MSDCAAILAEARRWIGTPYRHQASLCGAGCDCLGLVRGVWRAAIGAEPSPVPPYPADFGARPGPETLRDAARTWLVPVGTAEARPGDVLLFRARCGAPACHLAILSGADAMIHAYWGRAVCETPIGAWRRRLAGAFAFPDRNPSREV